VHFNIWPRIWMQFFLIKMDELWALFLAKWSSTNCVSEKIIEGQHPKILLHQDSPRPNLELKQLIHIWRRTSSNCTWRQGCWQMQLWNCTWVTTVLITCVLTWLSNKNYIVIYLTNICVDTTIKWHVNFD
jgi:hypothetical protein